MKSVVRVAGFFSKELREIARQPLLIVTLILGPFLILLLFGLGHRATEPPLRTILVVPEGVDLPVPPEKYQELLGYTMRVESTTPQLDDAVAQLREGRTDLVVAIPSDLYQRLASAEKATVAIIYNEIDPLMANYIRFIASSETANMNGKILEATLRHAIQPQGELNQFNELVDAETNGIQSDLSRGDVASAGQRVTRMDAAAAGLEGRLDAIGNLLAPSGQAASSGTMLQRLQATRATLSRFRNDLRTLSAQIGLGSPSVDDDLMRVRAGGDAIARSAAALGEQPAQVIASPLASQTENIAPIEPDFVAFYAPAVLALLLQHVAVTFGALAIVRERLFGAMELFRVAPVSPLQVLLGKYLAYTLLAALVTAVLTVLVVRELDVPFAGNYDFFAGVILSLVVASLGFGFVISLVSDSERQAVQLSMLMLIASVFFSGFIMRLDSFVWPVRGIAYVLPVTYGIETLQNVMLRGANAYFGLAALGVLALLMVSLAGLLLRREFGRPGGGQTEA